jgi:predicted nucleic acid-binding protein
LIVIDASTVISRVLADERTEEAKAAVFYTARKGALVPGNFVTEIMNALAKAERRGRIDPAEADLQLTEILNLPLTVEFPDPHAVLTATRIYSLTAYDAAYLALALQAGIPLATVDRPLAVAAKNAKCAWKPGRA